MGDVALRPLVELGESLSDEEGRGRLAGGGLGDGGERKVDIFPTTQYNVLNHEGNNLGQQPQKLFSLSFVFDV